MKKSLPDDSAFPFQYKFRGMTFTDLGMTLRDYFAAKALVGILSSNYPNYCGFDACELTARVAYQYADAMLKARQLPQESEESNG